jgi:hypothetical protein
MSSGATTSAGRAKKEWGRCRERLVAMGVALVEVLKPSCYEPPTDLTTQRPPRHPSRWQQFAKLCRNAPLPREGQPTRLVAIRGLRSARCEELLPFLGVT